jgi:hypothetical protein
MKSLVDYMHDWPASLVLIAAFVVFCGAVVGAYLGNRLSGRSGHDPYPVREESDTKSDKLSAGDLIPLEPFLYPDGSQGNFELLLGSKLLLVFVDLDCEECHRLSEFWTQYIRPNQDDSSSIFICAMTQEALPNDLFNEYGVIGDLIFVDEELFEVCYGIDGAPAFYSVDEFGLILFVQRGFRGLLRREILELALKPGDIAIKKGGD